MVRFRVPLALAAALLGLLAMSVASHAAAPAEMRVDAPSGTQVVGKPFTVNVSITRADATWAGYTDQLIYDPKVLKVNSVKPGGLADCKDPNTWANPQTSPTVLSACVFQSTTATGVSEIIEFECLKDGASELHLVTTAEDPVNGSALFNEGAAPIATDLVDATVSCGAGGPIETVAVPTNPAAPSSVPGGGTTPAPGGGTPGASGSAPAGGTPGAGGTSASGTAASGTDTAPNAALAPGSAATRQAATGTAAASKTSTAQGSTQSSGDSGMPAWLIAVIVVAVLAAAGGAGWLVLKRRGGASGG